MFEKETKTKQNDSCLFGFIDLLSENGLIKNEDKSLLKERNRTCEDLFDYLSNMGVLEEKRLTELYAKAKGLPYVDIKSIDAQAYSLIDQKLAKDYSFIPFSISEKTKNLQIAIADYRKISKISKKYLAVLERKIGYKIELFVTDRSALKNIQLLIQSDSKFPLINLESIFIDEAVLKKIPVDLAQKYKIIIFRQKSEKEYDVAISQSPDFKIMAMLEEMQKKSGIKFNIYTAAENQLNDIIESYKIKEKAQEERDQVQLQERAQAKVSLSDSDELSSAGKDEFLSQASNSDEISTKEAQSAENKAVDERQKDSLILDSSGLDENGEKKENDYSLESKLENPDLSNIIGSEKSSVELINKLATQGSIPSLLASIMALAIEKQSSDIHIEPFEKNTRLRFRVDGVLFDIAQLPSTLQPQIVARVKILSKLKLDEQRVPQDGRFDAKLGDELVDIRVSTLPTVFGEKVVMRLLSKTKKLEDLTDLGIEGQNYDRIIEAISKPYGVILATGPTGSGKSTTLYSIFNRLNKSEVNIITLEDPVEYEIAGINQVQVKPQIGFGFAEGLRSVLRQDPNIIMVGEIRDGETAELVVQAALTGHLVFSTLHTNDASSALPRMYNLGVEPFLLTSAINAVVAQRLVRRLCSKCKKEVNLPQSVSFQVKKELEKLNLNTPIKFYKGDGCPNCTDGFKGRLGIYEVLKMSREIEDLILDKKSAQDIFTQASKEGMITMKQDGLIKAIKGLTTVDEVFRVTREQNEEG
ncbi:MAG: Type II secretion system protein E [candidate division WS2 bacterium ADurb.Bin280]|uniref:Type II secretion system protein E n=1 Tax=candidate division WS2 bacterium ADurb.Bin280 TaxID=1852829 RepID=A0A1V5SDR5_9BACT|nr:MAG: Type II secretion system protein E [candidate division WS2 bacterium ADurb.Bin280]